MNPIQCRNHFSIPRRTLACSAVLGALLLALPISAYAGCNNSVTNVDNQACIAFDLRAADGQINKRYQELKRVLPYNRFVRIRNDQRQWLKRRDRTCELHIHVKTMDAWYRAVAADPLKAVCVTRLTQMRERVLAQVRVPGAPAAKAASPGGALAPTVSGETPVGYNGQYDFQSANTHSRGKYYFEVSIDRSQVVPAGGGLLYIGLRDRKQSAGAMLRMGYYRTGGTIVVGIAADLDNGMVYLRTSHGWNHGSPGSNNGSRVELGRDWHATAYGSVPLRNLLRSDTIRVNLGDSDFHYAMPAGYKPFR